MTQQLEPTPRSRSKVEEIKSKASRTVETYEEKVRESPEKAMLIAVATGYCLQFIPLTSLVTIPLRLTAVLAKPTLLALGAMKAYELYQGETKK